MVATFANAAKAALNESGFKITQEIFNEAFERISVHKGRETTVIDFAVDAVGVTQSSVWGPILADTELALNKVFAMFDRAEARDAYDL